MIEQPKEVAFENDDQQGALEYAKVMAAQLSGASLYADRWNAGVLETENGYHSLVVMYSGEGVQVEVSLHPVLQRYIAVVVNGEMSHKHIGDNLVSTLSTLLGSLKNVPA